MLDADSESIEILRCLMARYRKNKLTLMLRVLQLENDPTLLLHDLDPTEYRWLLEEDETTGEVDIVDYSKEIEAVITRAARSQSIKRDACRTLVNELVDQGNPIIIWCIFTSSMRNLRRDLLADGIDVRIIDGSVPIHDRTEILEAYRDGKFPVLITNPHTLAESVSLHSICHDAVYFEYSFNLVHLLQSKDRIHRLGLAEGQDTRYYFLMERYAVGGDNAYSMDQQIYQRLCGKEQTMLRAIEAGLIETQPTTEEDLEAIFNNLFKDER